LPKIYFDTRRPARARLFPFTLAVGGFVIGGFVIGMIYLVATDLFRPASTQEADRKSAMVHVPIYATAPAPFNAADPEELGNRTQFRPSIAKIAPPSDSAGAITPSRDTDRRGGGPDRRGRDTAISPKRGKLVEDRLQKIMQICRGC
jgi:hypothetical protein